MKKYKTTRMIAGLGHLVQIDEIKFSKRKFQVGRIVRRICIVGKIDHTTRESFFFKHTIEMESL
jgi:hypothetical protein